MARHHATPTGNIPFTAQEETARDAEALVAAQAKPMEDWKFAIKASDIILPRWGEDILDGMDKSGLAQISLDRLQAKKDKRGERP